jgi:hypothetical protein
MNIPIDIPNHINPEIQDPISKSVIYSFQENDYHIDNEGNLLYKFPYSKDTYWTNFKYSCYNNTKNQFENIEIGIKLVTGDNYEYCIQAIQHREDKVWYDTEWPFPSVNTFVGRSGLYFKVKPADNKSSYNIKISLLGFMDLFPKVENYILLSSFDTYQFVFTKYEDNEFLKYEDDELECVPLSIYNVENYDYIREIISKACQISLIKNY